MIDSIRSLIKDELNLTDEFIISQLKTHIPLVKEIIEYVLTSGGKRIRPMILLLSANALAHRGRKHIDLAAVIELIHTATLLHDDVVDDSTLRRGQQTANMVWGNNASVLIGDFLYSRAFQIVVDCKHDTILNIFSKATHYIAEGEILQLVNCHNPQTNEDFYFDIIRRKTAKLFEIAALLGATLATDDDDHIQCMSEYGQNIGLAYQLIDDALDYRQTPEETGKNVGQDIAEGKVTLPLIHAMRHSKNEELHIIQTAIQSGSNDQLPIILDIIESTGAIEYTINHAKQHAAQAKRAILQLHDSPYRKALESLSDFVVERNY